MFFILSSFALILLWSEVFDITSESSHLLIDSIDEIKVVELAQSQLAVVVV